MTYIEEGSIQIWGIYVTEKYARGKKIKDLTVREKSNKIIGKINITIVLGRWVPVENNFLVSHFFFR